MAEQDDRMWLREGFDELQLEMEIDNENEVRDSNQVLAIKWS